MNNKTLIGKDNYLFLINDSCKELEVHCNNLNLVSDKKLSRYILKNFLLIVLPNKSLIYKDYLPDDYKVCFRPALNTYKNVFGNKLIDTYEILKDQENVYYKTDTHINMKGNYIVYKYFIDKINEIYGLNIKHENINLLFKESILTDLKYGIGDLLWKSNLGEQTINEKDKVDTFFYSDDINYLYYNHKLQKNDSIRVLNKSLDDMNEVLDGSFITWEILSNYILYKKNNTENKLKVIIFYDSFLISLLDLYLKLFDEVYMIKEVYSSNYIDTIKPDYVFEFRVERFLF